MSQPSLAIQKLAARLVDCELTITQPAGEAAPAFPACDRLRVPLTKLTGSVGFSSLLSRALLLATRLEPSLKEWKVAADGTLMRDGLNDQPPATSKASRQQAVVFLAELIGLLVTLIGEALTLTIIREAWRSNGDCFPSSPEGVP